MHAAVMHAAVMYAAVMHAAVQVSPLHASLHESQLLNHALRCVRGRCCCRFFCALHPDMRRAWAEGWARRLRPGGTLIALAFPIEDSDRIGPPWPLQLADYEAALVLCGFKCVRQAAVPPAQATVPDRAEREILTLWVKE